jgi:hypothetical protein
LELHNPWNMREPAVVPLDELRACLDAVDIGSAT